MSSSTIKKRVLVGSPIYQKPAILKEFLESLKGFEKKSYTLDYYFVDDNEDEESHQLLQSFVPEKEAKVVLVSGKERVTKPYFCNEVTHFWSEELIWKVAIFRNQIIQYALENDYDYLFFVDSDLLLHPLTIEQLLSSNKDIISNIFWTKWTDFTPLQPQVWLSDQHLQFQVSAHDEERLSQEEADARRDDFFNLLRKPGVHEVGGLGACTLISKEALKKGVNYSRIKNIHFWGEDCHFCIRAVALGFNLYVDTHYPAYHIYREADLEGVQEFKQACQSSMKL